MPEDDYSVLPFVSFCISTYKRPVHLLQQLNAIARQTVNDFEVIVSDNDVVDQSAKGVVNQFNEQQFFYQVNTSNLGMVKSFNESLRRARGEYVVMLTDDDPVYPHFVETLQNLTVTYPGFGMYMASHNTKYESLLMAKLANQNPGVHSGLASLEIGAVRKFNKEHFLNKFCTEDFGGGILWSSGLVKRSIALAIGGVPDYNTPFMSDAAYVILAGCREGAVFVNEAVGEQVIHSENYSFSNANFDYVDLAPKEFYAFIKNALQLKSGSEDDKVLQEYLGKTLTTYYISLKKKMLYASETNLSFEKSIDEVYKWGPMKRWKTKYKIASQKPELFKLLLQVRRVLS